MRRIVMSGLVALAAVLGSAGTAVAVPAAPVPATAAAGAVGPFPGMRAEAAGSGAFFGFGAKISCGSPTACLAIGSSSTTVTGSATAEAWNGTAWKSVAVPVPKGASAPGLTGVSCKSATSCLVVGADVTAASDGGDVPSALTWNGKVLTPTAALPVLKGVSLIGLDAVSCVTATSCVAVGTSFGATSTLLVVANWNGAKWTLRTAKNPGGVMSAEPGAIRCFSVTSCVIAGTSVTNSGAEKLLMATWNGKAFTAMKAPSPAGAKSTTLLTDLSCTSLTRCVAVGLSQNPAGTTGFGFAEVLNGGTWTADKITWPKADTESFVLGVSCATATNCIAVGAAGTSNSGAAKALSYNGKAWSRLSVPGPGKGKSSLLTGVNCPKANDCVALGEIGASGAKTPATLSGVWNGKSWKLAAS